MFVAARIGKLIYWIQTEINLVLFVLFDHKNKINHKKYQLLKKYWMFYYQMSNDMRILH